MQAAMQMRLPLSDAVSGFRSGCRYSPRCTPTLLPPPKTWYRIPVTGARRLPLLHEVLESIRRREPFSLPILVALGQVHGPLTSDEDATGVTTVAGTTPDIPLDAMTHLVESPCVVAEEGGAVVGISRLTIGRSRACDYRLPERSVSAVHAHLVCNLADSDYYLSDAGSRNGTCVGGVRLAPGSRAFVWPGAIIHFGLAAYCFLDAPTLRKLAALVPLP